MKNDTASFFGPFFWGSFDPYMLDNVRLAYTERPKTRRTVFFSHWCTEMIAHWIEQFPQAAQLIRPRRVPTVILENERVYGFHPDVKRWVKIDKSANLPDHSPHILSLVDGERFLSDLLDEAHTRFGLAEAQTREVIDALVSAGLIYAHLEIPVGLHQPMNYLEALLQDVDVPEAQAMIAKFQAWKQDFTVADLEQRHRLFTTIGDLFKQLTNTDPTRGRGQHYADRTIFYEDGTRNFSEFAVGGTLFEQLNTLGPVWDLLCLPNEREYELLQGVMVQRFRKWFPHRSRVRFVDYVSAFVEDSLYLNDQLATIRTAVEVLMTDIFNQLVPPEDLTRTVVRCDMSDIRRIIEHFASPVTPGAVINPDILIAAHGREALDAGEYQIVLGEVHASVDLLTHSPLAYFLADSDKALLKNFVRQRYTEVARSDEWIADLIRIHKRKTSAFLSILGVEVEGLGRSQKARDAVVALAELEVHLDQGELRLYAPCWQRYIRLTNMRLPNGGVKDKSPLRPFSLPEQEGGLCLPLDMPYCPRIEVGKLVLVRRTWQLDYHHCSYSLGHTHAGWDFGLFMHMLKLQHHFQFPNHVFAKIAGEPKPIFVDFDNYFLIHAFFKKWRKHGGIVTITEALPSSDNAWLEDEDGRYLCEMRLGWYRKSKGSAVKND